MKRKLRALTGMLLTVVFVASMGMIVWRLMQYAAARQANDQALQIALEPAYQDTVPQTVLDIPEQVIPAGDTPTEAPAEEPGQTLPQLPMDETVHYLLGVDIAALQQVNGDVLGWIHIPDTAVSYPLMTSQEPDAYLYTAWDGTPNEAGSIFLERKNYPDLSDFNTIIYGHHMADGSMFAPIVRYKYQKVFDRQPYIYIATADRIFRYQVFAAYEADIESDTYRLYFADDAQKQAALDHYLQSSLWKGAPIPTVEDWILTLSTCTGFGDYSVRFVVQAVLDGIWAK